MKNKIEDLRNHLFETLEALKDPERPMEIERAKAVAEVAKVIVDSAKVEVDFVKATGASAGTGFVPVADLAPRPHSAPPAQLAAGPTSTPSRRCTNCTATTAADPCDVCGTPWRRSA